MLIFIAVTASTIVLSSAAILWMARDFRALKRETDAMLDDSWFTDF